MAQMRLTRRALLQTGATLALGSAVFEAASLRGAFDNRTPPALELAERFQQQLRALDALPGGGLLHIGQSTHLLGLGGMRVLTDPWFYDPAFGTLRHPRAVPNPELIHDLDIILITHDHPDHADRKALDRLDKRALVVVGVRELIAPLRALGFARVEHVPAWQTLAHGALSLTGVPALHDVPETGYVLQSGPQSIYFAGDTATIPDFAAIAERWRLALAILPIDGTRIRWERRLVMDPSDAASAAAILTPRQVMAGHADAVHADWLAEHVLSEHARAPHATFARLLAERAPSVRYARTRAGEHVAL